MKVPGPEAVRLLWMLCGRSPAAPLWACGGFKLAEETFTSPAEEITPWLDASQRETAHQYGDLLGGTSRIPTAGEIQALCAGTRFLVMKGSLSIIQSP